MQCGHVVEYSSSSNTLWTDAMIPEGFRKPRAVTVWESRPLPPGLATIGEAAARCGVHKQTLRNWVNKRNIETRGLLAAPGDGNPSQPLVALADVLAYKALPRNSAGHLRKFRRSYTVTDGPEAA
tara:strand:+ start:1297 stop:1671 length:375 start_codon:yes stop_codon:yes gene_type:complete